MSNELHPRVAEILNSEHRAGPAEVQALSARDSAELLEIASGATHQEFRVKAMSVLATARHERAGELLRDAIRDRTADDTVRAAGVTWFSRVAGEDAEATLTNALADEQTPVVRHKIIAGLARIGTDDAIGALSAAIDQPDPGLREHAEFARSVVAYRLGRTGFELPVVEQYALLPSPEVSPATFYVTDPESTLRVVDQIADDSYGVLPGHQSATWLHCGRQRFAILVGPQIGKWPKESLGRPTIAGLVALRAETDGSLHTSMLILTWPQGESRVYVSVNRVSGRAMYFGHGQVQGESVSFRLDAVRRPGATATTVTGILVDGAPSDLQLGLGATLAARQPMPLED